MVINMLKPSNCMTSPVRSRGPTYAIRRQANDWSEQLDRIMAQRCLWVS